MPPPSSEIKRPIIRWDDQLNVCLLLAVDQVTKAQKDKKFPWDQVAPLISNTLTGSAIEQHLTKTRKRKMAEANVSSFQALVEYTRKKKNSTVQDLDVHADKTLTQSAPPPVVTVTEPTVTKKSRRVTRRRNYTEPDVSDSDYALPNEKKKRGRPSTNIKGGFFRTSTSPAKKRKLITEPTEVEIDIKAEPTTASNSPRVSSYAPKGALPSVEVNDSDGPRNVVKLKVSPEKLSHFQQQQQQQQQLQQLQPEPISFGPAPFGYGPVRPSIEPDHLESAGNALQLFNHDYASGYELDLHTYQQYPLALQTNFSQAFADLAREHYYDNTNNTYIDHTHPTMFESSFYHGPEAITDSTSPTTASSSYLESPYIVHNAGFSDPTLFNGNGEDLKVDHTMLLGSFPIDNSFGNTFGTSGSYSSQ